MKRRQNFQTISWFFDIFSRGRLNLDPPYQRRSVWNQAYKEYFIDTIILDYPAPAIFLYEDINEQGIATYNVVDGKQRLTTIFEFIDNKFNVDKNSEKVELQDKYFSEFSKEDKGLFWSYSFSVEYLPTSDLAVINNVFNRINRNVAKLTAQELRHAKYSGDFIVAVETFTDELFVALPKDFPRISPKSMREMKDYEFIAQLFLRIEDSPKGYSGDELDFEFSNRENDWEKKNIVIESYKRVINHLVSILKVDSDLALIRTRLRNQADFYSLFGALFHLDSIGNRLDYSKVYQKLLSFALLVDDDNNRDSNEDAKKYYEHTRTASNRTLARKEREDILIKVIIA